MSKRVIAIFLVLCLYVAALAGCSKPGEPATQMPTTEPAETPEVGDTSDGMEQLEDAQDGFLGIAASMGDIFALSDTEAVEALCRENGLDFSIFALRNQIY